MNYKALQEHFRRLVGVYGLRLLLERLTSSGLVRRPDLVMQMLLALLFWETATASYSLKSYLLLPVLPTLDQSAFSGTLGTCSLPLLFQSIRASSIQHA